MNSTRNSLTTLLIQTSKEMKTMKDRKFGTEVVNATQEVNGLNGVKQVVNIDTSDIEKLSNEDVSAIAHNVSHKIQLKQDDEA